jgi:hypothetical protein
MPNRDNLKVDCGGAVTDAALALRNAIRAVALTYFDLAQPHACDRSPRRYQRRRLTGVKVARCKGELDYNNI